MNSNFLKVLQASENDWRNLFLEAAVRLGTPLRNVEKDFWVCFVLDLLFNGKSEDEPRLLFKGDTSLSKAHDLISRFSEDIDITVYREDIGHPADIATLQSWGRNKRNEYLDAIKAACSTYKHLSFCPLAQASNTKSCAQTSLGPLATKGWRFWLR